MEANKAIGKVQDTTEQSKLKLLEQSLLETEAKYRGIVEQSIVGVFIAQAGVFAYSNPHLNQMLGYDSLIGVAVLDTIHADDRDAVSEKMLNLSEGQLNRSISYKALKQDGTSIICEVHFTKIVHEGTLATVATILDITDRRNTEELNYYLAYHDYLTQLPNRRMFEEQLDKQLRLAQFYNKKVAVLVIDLDRFKSVNDTLGHAIGDTLLKQFAHKLQNYLGEDQTVYRLSGDEFCIVLSEVNHPRETMDLSERIIHITKEEYLIQGYELNITISIGISMFPEDGDTVDDLLKSADTVSPSRKAGIRLNIIPPR